MIGKVIGAFMGDRIAKQTKGVGGATGAALGVLATTVLRRMSLPAMLALGAGGYAAKKFMDKKDAEDRQAPTTTSSAPVGTTTTKAA